MTVEERFWSKVDVRGPGECWPWKASTSEGYGQFFLRGKNVKSHRVAWELTNGPVPAGFCVLHRCDYRPCCNPSCLFLGTKPDNNEDMVSKGRQARGETHSTCYPRGEKCGWSRLTDAQVLEIRRRYADGSVSQSQLALEFGISQRAVSKIVRGEVWKHLLF